jgi:transglutaminase-like putative cysteine protease
MAFPRLLSALILIFFVGSSAIQSAAAPPRSAILHEPILPDPREDLALSVVLDGDLPAALRTPNGILQAPDPRQLPRPSESTYGPGTEHDTFEPDRETRRPDVSGYDDPFTPSTAPFKRLEAFDGVHRDYSLYVRDERLAPVPIGASQGPDDAAFFGDLVVDLDASRSVRIPSVGPGARLVRARLGVGAEEVAMRVMRDGADNWFLQAYRARAAIRARVVMEVVAPQAAFGGPLGDPAWNELPTFAPLPDNVAREAALVQSAIGVSHRIRPRQAIAKLVQYFRGFSDSSDPPRGRGSVYLDLALSKKGVCRHRAFAFLVTAQGLGIPTRMILNEAHAWVEVHDGTLWRRLDLGGAGRLAPAVSEAIPERAAYEPPPDAFAWPQDAQRGGAMVADARARVRSAHAGVPGAPSSSAQAGAAAGGRAAVSPAPATSAGPAVRDDRPLSSLAITVVAPEVHRGLPLDVHGEVRADGEVCPHVAVELWLRAADGRKTFLLGTLATGESGTFAGGIVVPAAAPLGDYDVIARTAGDARCGVGSTE